MEPSRRGHSPAPALIFSACCEGELTTCDLRFADFGWVIRTLIRHSILSFIAPPFPGSWTRAFIPSSSIQSAPRIRAVRGGELHDLVICFECVNVMVFEGDL